jgi:hypothetical protein
MCVSTKPPPRQPFSRAAEGRGYGRGNLEKQQPATQILLRRSMKVRIFAHNSRSMAATHR